MWDIYITPQPDRQLSIWTVLANICNTAGHSCVELTKSVTMPEVVGILNKNFTILTPATQRIGDKFAERTEENKIP